MADVVELKASARDRVGKGVARSLRREGHIPGVIYGDKKPPQPITLDYKSVWMQHQKGQFLSTVMMIDVAGKKSRVIPRDVQFDPVRDFILHVDFLRVSKGAELNVDVIVQFINEDKAPGLVRGGALNVVRHQVELICPADAIPEALVADLTGMEIGDSLHISAISLPEGVRATIQDRDFTIASIAGAGGGSSEAEDGEEGEVEEEAGEDA